MIYFAQKKHSKVLAIVDTPVLIRKAPPLCGAFWNKRNRHSSVSTFAVIDSNHPSSSSCSSFLVPFSIIHCFIMNEGKKERRNEGNYKKNRP